MGVLRRRVAFFVPLLQSIIDRCPTVYAKNGSGRLLDTKGRITYIKSGNRGFESAQDAGVRSWRNS